MKQASVTPVLHAMALALAALGLLANPASAGTDGGTRALATAALPLAASANASAPRADASQLFRGVSLSDLTANSWRRVLSLPLAADTTADPSGRDCAINQDGAFWYLNGPIGVAFTATCTVPAGKALVVPIATYLNDFPCPDPAFRPAAGQSLQDFLAQGAAAFVDTYTLAQAQLDGRPLPVRRVATQVFGFTAAADWSQADGCITGSPQIAASDGYFTFIEPLPRGNHVVHVRSVGTFSGTSEGTLVLKVR